MIGAVAGPLLALSLLAAGIAFKSVLLIALVPGLLAAGCVLWLVKERAHDPAARLAAGPPAGATRFGRQFQDPTAGFRCGRVGARCRRLGRCLLDAGHGGAGAIR